MKTVKKMLDDCIRHLGIEALYFDQNRIEPLVVRIILQPADRSYSVGGSHILAPTAQIVVKKSDVQEPKVGDLFSFDEINYEIVQDPEPDHLNHVWQCQVVQQCP